MLISKELNKTLFPGEQDAARARKTKDILHVMQVLGHREIKNTLLYTQLIKVEEDNEFICKVAREPREIQELIEAGFEYVLEKDGLAYFRKRK